MKEFNFNEALEMLKQGYPVDGKDGVLAPLIKQLGQRQHSPGRRLQSPVKSCIERNFDFTPSI